MKQKTFIVTSGEDEVIRFWDNKFNLIYEIKIRNLSIMNECPIEMNLSG